MRESGPTRSAGGRRAAGGAIAIGAAVAAAIALVALYLALGGSDYAPSPVADPCAPREWRDPGDLEEVAEQFFLSALDGAACALGVSREELAPALATDESRAEFAAERGIDPAELEDAVQAGLARAVDDAEAAGALPGFAAGPLREVAGSVPVDEAVAAMTDVREFILGAGDLLDRIF